MNVSKPRPNDHPLLVLFIVGGITCSEVHQIREALAAYHPNTQVSNDVFMLKGHCHEHNFKNATAPKHVDTIGNLLTVVKYS